MPLPPDQRLQRAMSGAGVGKAMQRGLYTLASTKNGALALLFAATALLLTLLHVVPLLLTLLVDSRGHWSLTSHCPTAASGSLCTPPIDAVYTWVNGSDDNFLRELLRYQHQANMSLNASSALSSERARNKETEDKLREMSSASRYRDNDELRYSLRSLELRAPWIRHIYIVTNGQVPYWLDLSNPKVSVVPHSAIFPNPGHLPTFSSPAIECHIHRIPNLSHQFIYLNDDIMFGEDVWPDDWNTLSNGQKVFLTWDVPLCNHGCVAEWKGDGYCDVACNVSSCEFDRGDCKHKKKAAKHTPAQALKDKVCAPGCQNKWVGDRYCDPPCKNTQCGYDAGDCGIEVLQQNVFGFTLDPAVGKMLITLESSNSSVYVNLTKLFPTGQITAASHTNSALIQAASISQHLKVLTLVFKKPAQLPTNSTVYMSGKLNNKEMSELNFNFTLQIVANSTGNDTLNEGEEDDDNQSGYGYEGHMGEEYEEGDKVDYSLTSGASTKEAYENFGSEYHYNTEEDLGNNKGSFDAYDDEEAEYEPEPRRYLNWWEYPMPGETYATGSSKNEHSSRSPGRRQLLLDVYGLSLRHVDDLYTKEYGQERRQVPAHMPHFLDRHVIERMQLKWPDQFQRTSSNRFRSPTDMQYAFSYFYFLMHERKQRTAKELVAQYDQNADGYLDDNELKTLIVRISDISAEEDLSELKQSLIPLTGTKFGDGRPVSNKALLSHPRLDRLMRRHLAKERLYKFEKGNSDLVGFHMINANETESIPQLQNLRKKPSKFICLNDNMDNPENSSVPAEIEQLYHALYPNPSSYELPPYENGYTHLDDWNRNMRWVRMRKKAWTAFTWLLWSVPVLVIFGWAWWQVVLYGGADGRHSPPPSPRSARVGTRHRMKHSSLLAK